MTASTSRFPPFYTIWSAPALCWITQKLTELNTLFDKEMNKLSAEIYELAGEEFNLSSPKQIGEILYTKLGLKGKKHTSGSLNTSAEVLEQMAETHELPRKILDWRQYQKLNPPTPPPSWH